MSSIAPSLSSTAGSAVSSTANSSSGDSSSQALLQEEQAQFEANFALQTHQAMIDNQNATNTAIAQSHAQTASASTSGAREVGDSNAHIVA